MRQVGRLLEMDEVQTAPAEQSGLSLEVLVQYFEESEKASREYRFEAERDRDFYNGAQWTAAEAKALMKRGQNPIVVNKIRGKIDTLLGIEKQQRTEVRAFPRTPQHEQAAEAATDAIRYVLHNNNFDAIRSSVWENLLIEGCGACEVNLIPGRDGPEIDIAYIQWDRFFADPFSIERNYEDARYLGYVTWLDRDMMVARYGDEGAAAFANTVATVGQSDTYDDRQPAARWASQNRQRIALIRLWYRDAAGEWHWCTYTLGAMLEAGESPYLDEDQATAPAIHAVRAYVDRHGNNAGRVRDMVPINEELNKRRSKALHLFTMRQSRISRGAGLDTNEVRKQLSMPDGAIQADAGEFEILPTGDMGQGQIFLLQHADQELENMGPAPALAGDGAQSASGRSVLAQQQSGLVPITHLMDALRMWQNEVARAVWMMVRQFWREERWVRVTDDERNTRFVGLNHQETFKDYLASLPKQQALQIVQQMQLQPGDPRLEMATDRTLNKVDELDVDIVLNDVPDVVSVQAEQFGMLVDMMRTGAVTFPPRLLIEASALRNKEELLEMLEQSEQESGASAQGQAQLDQAEQSAKIQKLTAEANHTKAQTMMEVAEMQQSVAM